MDLIYARLRPTHKMTQKTLLIASLALVFCPFSHPQAEETPRSCIKAYEEAAGPYWLIVSDILRFKTMFDNYDRLCSTYYPDDIAALEPASGLLRAQTTRDVKNAERIVDLLFKDTTRLSVPAACQDDKAAREQVRKNLRQAMKTQSKTIGARLEKSALTISNPDQDLKLCRNLKPLKKKVEKALGPDLANPLLEMSAANSKFITRDSRQRKEAMTAYRSLLMKLDDDAIKSAPAK